MSKVQQKFLVQSTTLGIIVIVGNLSAVCSITSLLFCKMSALIQRHFQKTAAGSTCHQLPLYLIYSSSYNVLHQCFFGHADTFTRYDRWNLQLFDINSRIHFCFIWSCPKMPPVSSFRGIFLSQILWKCYNMMSQNYCSFNYYCFNQLMCFWWI